MSNDSVSDAPQFVPTPGVSSPSALLPSPEAGMIWGPFLADALNSRSTLRTVPLSLLT